VIGVCGGYQMLGERLIDELGDAGDRGTIEGLSLLPAITVFRARKTLRQVTVVEDGSETPAYEIHMGDTRATTPIDPLNRVKDGAGERAEGMRRGNVWGTYLHGWFDSPAVRRRVSAAARIAAHEAHPQPWAEQRRQTYRAMAAHLAAHVNLDPVKRYLCS
jgi:adenosylcobyric acid synthase